MIDGDSWTVAVATGWRFLENCPSNDTEFNAMRVAAAVQQYGQENVSIGTTFLATSPAPLSKCVGFAIYVRDGNEILAELREDLVNYECGHEMVA